MLLEDLMNPRARHFAKPVDKSSTPFLLMKSSFVLTAAILVLGCEWIYTEAPYEVKKCMASVDGHFIPALWYSQKGNADSFSKAMNSTIDAWRACRPQFDRFFKDDETTVEVTATVDSLFQAAQTQAGNGDLQTAHETLEQVKDVMRTARRQQDMVYILDMLEPLHDTVTAMYRMVTAATDTAGTVDTALLDLDTLRRLVESAQSAVQSVVVVRVRPETTSLDSADMRKYSKRLQIINDTSYELFQAVQNQNMEEAVSLTKKMRVTYQRIYLLFGSFSEKPSILRENFEPDMQTESVE